MITIEKELEGLYQTRKTEKGIEAEFTAAETLSFFSGHFPRMPILPAVAIVDISHYFAQKVAAESFEIQKVSNMRLKQPIHAREFIKITLDRESERDYNVIWKSAENRTLVELSLEAF